MGATHRGDGEFYYYGVLRIRMREHDRFEVWGDMLEISGTFLEAWHPRVTRIRYILRERAKVMRSKQDRECLLLTQIDR